MNLRYHACVVVVAWIMGCQTNQSGESPAAVVTFADQLFEGAVDSQFIAGASVIVMRDGDMLIDKAYGFASLELEAPMPENASFDIGSVTKQFTSAAILRLQEQGTLALSDDFTEYVSFDTGGRHITVGDLLDHRSGIASYTEIPEFWHLSLHTFPRDTLLRIAESNDFLFEPGEAIIYNNTAYYILGLIIEAVSDTTYAAYLQQEFFDPLDMHDTHYCSTSRIVKDKAYGYGYTPDGLRQKGYLDHTWPFAAGSLCSTPDDLIKWMRSLHEGRLFNHDVYTNMITPGVLNNGEPVRYAKGLVNYQNHGHQMIGHGGGINGFLSDTRYYPEDDLYIIVLVNTTGPKSATFFAEELSWHLLDKSQPDGIPQESLEDISGVYSGQARGRPLRLTVNQLDDAITVRNDDSEGADTIRQYLGQQTWLDGTDLYKFSEDTLHIDAVYNHYVFAKE